MPTTTTNYGFTKPSGGEAVNIATLNADLDSIDTRLKTNADASQATSNGAVAKSSLVLNVKDYGAKGDGTTDDAAAFAAAITAAQITGSARTIFVPSSTSFYKIGTTLTTFSGMVLEGVESSAFASGTEIRFSGSGPLFQMGTDNGHAQDANEYDGLQTFVLRSVQCSAANRSTALSNGQGNYAAGTYGVRDWRGGDVLLDRVRFTGFEYGFWGIQSDINSFRGVDLRYCKNGIYLGPRSDQPTITQMYAAFCDRVAVVDGAMGARFRDCQFVGNGSSSVNPILIKSEWARGTQAVDFDNCWFEHLQGATFIEAFVEVGPTGSAYTAADVSFRNPIVFTNAQASANYAQHLVKVGEQGNRVHIEAKAQTTAMASLLSLVKTDCTTYRNVTIEADYTLRQMLITNSGSFVVSPLFYALSGGTNDGFTIVRPSTSTIAMRVYGSADSVSRWRLNTNGRHEWGGGALGTDADTNLYRASADVLQTDDAFVVTDALKLKTKAGSVADGDFLHTPSDGSVAFNTTNARLETRSGGVWRGAATAGRHVYRPTAYFAETCPRGTTPMSSQSALSTGRASLTAVYLYAGEVVSSITMASGSTAAATVNNIWFALTTSAGVQVGISADDGTNGWAANATKTLNLTAAYTVPTTGFYYVVVLVNATTVPTVVGMGQSSTIGILSPSLGANDTTHTGLTNPASAPSTFAMSNVGTMLYAALA